MKKQPALILLLFLTVFFSACGGSYTNEVPINEEEVAVTVTDKVNLSEDWNVGRYSDMVLFTFNVENRTDKDVKGVGGILTIKDLFGVEIISIQCDFTGQTIPAGSTITVSDLGMDINEFMDGDLKVFNEQFPDLLFEYQVSDVVFQDSSPPQNVGETPLINSKNVVVSVTNKVNLQEDWDAGRYSDRVEFEFNLSNLTDKDIKGIQGILTTKDMFGADIISINCDFTGNTLLAGCSLKVEGLGMDINEFMDDHIKLYNEEFSGLIFEYEVTSIIYVDGTTE